MFNLKLSELKNLRACNLEAAVGSRIIFLLQIYSGDSSFGNFASFNLCLSIDFKKMELKTSFPS